MTQVLSSYKEEIKNAKMPAGRKQVLLAGLKLFSENGFHATTTAEIARQAGVSEGTIYKYFRSKNDLLTKLLSPVLREIQQNFFLQIDDYHDLPQLVAFLVEDRVQFALINFDFLKLIWQELLTNQKMTYLFKEYFVGDDGASIYAEKLKARFSEIDQQLTPVQIYRIFLGPIFAYIFQVKIFKTGLASQSEDLQLIEEQILASLTE